MLIPKLDCLFGMVSIWSSDNEERNQLSDAQFSADLVVPELRIRQRGIAAKTGRITAFGRTAQGYESGQTPEKRDCGI
ncbi:hypothetical protein OG216_28690 [Streptomycetaceae bacterium NBC_01309]